MNWELQTPKGKPIISFGKEDAECPYCGNKELKGFIEGNVNTYAILGTKCKNGHKFNQGEISSN